MMCEYNEMMCEYNEMMCEYNEMIVMLFAEFPEVFGHVKV
jgi:hypothetical protein